MDGENQPDTSGKEPEVKEVENETKEVTETPALDTTQSVETLQKGAKPKGGNKTIAYLVAAVLVAVAGWFVFKSMSGASVQDDLNQAVAKFIKMEGVSASFEFADAAQMPFEASLHFDATIPALAANFSILDQETNTEAVSVDLRGIADKWYFNAKGLSVVTALIGEFMPAELASSAEVQAFLETVAESLATLENKWLFIDSAVISELSTALLGEDVTTETGDIGISSAVKAEDFATLAALYLAHPFIVVQNSEATTLDGASATLVTVGIDAAEATAFSESLAATTFESKLVQSLSDSAESDTAVSAEDVADVELSIWMVGGNLVRIPAAEDDSVFINLSYGDSVESTAPDGARALQMSDIEVVLSLFF